ncbi:MAG TPA: HAMP domain-containing sensor histidine kinase [Bacteroidales bacterium]|nr:HAMP domain-containing sensor histidine kinase [Bacteroidales bacterium]
MNTQPSNTELKNLVEKLTQELHDKENEVSQLKRSFLANVSHEIRTPMNVIVGFSNLLTDPNFNDEQKKLFIAEINKNSRELLRLIDQILLIAKIQNNDLEIILSECNLSALIEDLHAYFKDYLDELGYKKIELRTINDILSTSNVILITDKDRLKESIKSLVENAIRFTRQGTISFGFTLNDNDVQFFVRDTGIGIEDKHLKLIFEKFYKIKNTDETYEMGLGIGLSIAERLIHLLGGKLNVASVPGKGTEFTFSIPKIIAKQKNLAQ